MATSVSSSYNPYSKNYKDAILSMLHEKQNSLSSIKLAFGVREYFYYQINDMCYSVGKSNSTFTASSLASYTEAADKIVSEAKAESARTTRTELVLGDMLERVERNLGCRIREYRQYP